MKKLFRSLFLWLEGKDPANAPPEYINELDLEWIEDTRKRLVKNRFRTGEISSPEAVTPPVESPIMSSGLREALTPAGQSPRALGRWFVSKREFEEDDWSNRVEESLIVSRVASRRRQEQEAKSTEEFEAEWLKNFNQKVEYDRSLEMESGADESAPIILSGPTLEPSYIEQSSSADVDKLIESSEENILALPVYPENQTISRVSFGAQKQDECEKLFSYYAGFSSTGSDDSELPDDLKEAEAAFEIRRRQVEKELEDLLSVDPLSREKEEVTPQPVLAIAGKNPEKSVRRKEKRGKRSKRGGQNGSSAAGGGKV